MPVSAEPQLAILNGFGRSLGDGIIGLQALAASGLPRPVLFRLPGLPVAVRDLYAAADFATCRDLDWAWAGPGPPVPGTEGFRVIDLRDFAFDPEFRGMAMLDFFLERLGVSPAGVPPASRRNAWLAPRLRPLPPGRLPGYALLCPRASMELRGMPPEMHAHIVGRLRSSGLAVVTQGEASAQALPMPEARSLAELAGWVAGAALLVSTDTAMVHLADAYDVPTLAVFTTHRPEWRVRDYPRCRAVYRPAALPPALEFSRGAADLAASRQAWFGEGGDLSWIDGPLDDTIRESRGVRPRPA